MATPMNARAPKGTADMLPDTARAWEFMTRTAQELFARYGYEPIYTPVFEHTEVFTRGIGEATDIVSKEMYTFEDKGGRSITLRPEGTASVVRSALEHHLTANGQSAKLYYAGPMFRYERPQAGRMRQFWQIGIEALNLPAPTVDAEVIAVLMEFYAAVGVPRDRSCAAAELDGRREAAGPRIETRSRTTSVRTRATCARSATAARTPTRCARSTARTSSAARSWRTPRCCVTSSATSALRTTAR